MSMFSISKTDFVVLPLRFAAEQIKNAVVGAYNAAKNHPKTSTALALTLAAGAGVGIFAKVNNPLFMSLVHSAGSMITSASATVMAKASAFGSLAIAKGTALSAAAIASPLFPIVAPIVAAVVATLVVTGIALLYKRHQAKINQLTELAGKVVDAEAYGELVDLEKKDELFITQNQGRYNAIKARIEKEAEPVIKQELDRIVSKQANKHDLSQDESKFVVVHGEAHRKATKNYAGRTEALKESTKPQPVARLIENSAKDGVSFAGDFQGAKSDMFFWSETKEVKSNTFFGSMFGLTVKATEVHASQPRKAVEDKSLGKKVIPLGKNEVNITGISQEKQKFENSDDVLNVARHDDRPVEAPTMG